MRAARRAALALFAASLTLAAGRTAAQDLPKPDAPMPASWPTRAAEVSVSYKIDAQIVETVLGDGIRIVGDETVFWKNVSQEPVKVVYLHTYANAFRSTRSTFLREAMRDGFELPDDMRFSDLKFTRVSTHDEELVPKWVSPDDGNPDDRTVARLDLDNEVEPGETLSLRIGFTLEMPRVVRRMGSRGAFVMGAQWYPKLGMHVGVGSKSRNVQDGWYCHQYHANCEFAANFADYDVTLRFPREFKVGATGHPQGEDVTDEETGITTRRYRAESVVDFAWVADKRFEVREYDVVPVDPDDREDPVAAEWRLRTSERTEPASEAALPTVKVVLLLQPEHADQAPRMLEAARVALGLFGTWLGPYPYGRLTIVDPPWSSAAAGGMEYPMLVTAGTAAGSLRGSHRPEGVIIHEIGHQWFMALLASNEAEEAWLDEGFTTYLTSWAMHIGSKSEDAGFSGPATQTTEILGLKFPVTPMYEFPGIATGWPQWFDLPAWARPGKIEILRLWRDLPPLSYVKASRYRDDPMLALRRSYVRRAGVDEMVKSGWQYADRTSYSVNAYSRPALFLSTLRRAPAAAAGTKEADRVFFRALREYARAFRFRHPTTDDFLRTWKENAADPGPAADQLIRSAARFDYAVEKIRSAKDPKLVGFDANGVLHRTASKDDDVDATSGARSGSVVRISRRGQAMVPVTLLVNLKDGTSERRVWEPKDQAKATWRDLTFEGEVVSAVLDPDAVYLQDTDLSNNSLTLTPDARPAVKWSVRFVGWLGNALLSYGRFF